MNAPEHPITLRPGVKPNEVQQETLDQIVIPAIREDGDGAVIYSYTGAEAPVYADALVVAQFLDGNTDDLPVRVWWIHRETGEPTWNAPRETRNHPERIWAAVLPWAR